MTTEEISENAISCKNIDRLEANLARAEELTQRLLGVMGKGRAVPAALAGPSPDLYAKAMGAYWAEMAQNPAKILEHQLEYWSKWFMPERMS